MNKSILAIVVVCLNANLSLAAEQTPEPTYLARWEPLYTQCSDKFYANLVAPILIEKDRNSLTDTERENLDAYLAQANTLIVTMCFCVADNTATALTDSGIEITDFEIEYLAQSFRFDTLYPDPNVRQIFGLAAAQCSLSER